MGDPVTGSLQRPLAIAHRGDPIAFRENTVRAVQAAIDAGADLVEIDVKTTADGVSIVLHDDSLVRLWGLDRDVRSMSLTEVSRLGSGVDRIPTFEQVLALFEGQRSGVLVDMDSSEWAPAAWAAVHAAVMGGVLRASQVVWCGDLDGMCRIRAEDPAARIYLSWGWEAGNGPPSDELIAQLKPEAFNPHWRALEAGGRTWAAQRGIPVSCWTVDDPEVMNRLVRDGVDALISNDIRTLMGVVTREAKL